jgi:hypothetical protein
MNRQFAEKQKSLVQAWNSYALSGDAHAAQIVDADVRSHMKETGIKEYGEALADRRTQVRALEHEMRCAPSAFDGDSSDAGSELDKVAKKNQELDRTLSYGQALKLACLENPKLASRYIGRDVRLDGVEETRKHFETAQVEKRYETTPSTIVGNMVSAAPRLPSGEIDVDAAVDACNRNPDAVRSACSDRLDVLIRDAINLEGIPGSEAMRPEMQAAIRGRVRGQHADLARAAESGVITVRGLVDLLPQKFKK